MPLMRDQVGFLNGKVACQVAGGIVIHNGGFASICPFLFFNTADLTTFS
jgi:hypothetical protein